MPKTKDRITKIVTSNGHVKKKVAELVALVERTKLKAQLPAVYQVTIEPFCAEHYVFMSHAEAVAHANDEGAMEEDVNFWVKRLQVIL